MEHPPPHLDLIHATGCKHPRLTLKTIKPLQTVSKASEKTTERMGQ
jgi:hypothetical protein